jgi:hypothetical protein
MLDPNLILTASLQTRYKFALYLIYRPYIYKALHTPELVTKDDLEGCAKALYVSSCEIQLFIYYSTLTVAGLYPLANTSPYFSESQKASATPL